MMIWIAVLCILLSGVAASEALGPINILGLPNCLYQSIHGLPELKSARGRSPMLPVRVRYAYRAPLNVRKASAVDQAASWSKLSPGLASVRRRGPDLDRTNSAQATQGSVSAQRSV